MSAIIETTATVVSRQQFAQTGPKLAPTRILDNDALRRWVPSIFAAAPHSGVSSRYRFVPTIEVVDMLRDKGFMPIRAEQSRSRTEDRRDVTKHMIRFRHLDYLAPALVGDEFPEVVLYNSHDLSAAYRFASGIFRLACSNGLVVATSSFGNVSVRHTGGPDFQDRIIDATCQIIEDTPRVIKQVEEWKQLILPAPAQRVYAEAAAQLVDNEDIKAERFLVPRRSEDRTAPDGSRSLWTTFNTVQEAIVKGGVRGVAKNGRRFQTRPVKAVDKDIRLNKALWTLTEKMAELI